MSEKHKFLPPSIAELRAKRKPLVNVSDVQKTKLKTLDKLACAITDKVGSMGFFLIIFGWTVLWCGYNILASEVPGLHWTSFDPFPAFVAYLLISNVIQILLMPLIMVGQNVQSQHSDLRAQSDLDVNVKAEDEIEAILKHLEMQNAMLTALLDQQGIKQDAILEEMHKRAAAAT
ncbi:MAG TPA: DUF1003 domain-containing protein [Fimbriimonadaceae bacterium]|jgi:uncharacterized membrane protein